KAFRFDHVFSAEAQQSDVYNASLQPLLASLLHGFNVTVLAYGQTGSGKTHTMGGAGKSTLEAGNNDGLISRFLRDLFEAVRNEASMKMMINVSFLEVYCDEIRDLLIDGEQARSNSQNDIRRRSAARLTIREDDQDVWVEGLRKVNVKSVDEALNLLETGRQRQAIGAHALNYHSSRSHAVYTLDISRVLPNEIKGAKLTFVDLAGSERLKKTLMEGQDMKEGSHINSMVPVVFANSISGSDTFDPRVSAHVPYRSSKLTRLLRDALGGNSVTLFIACISPEATNSNETLCTLQYANRARSIQNTARNNVEEAD
uniref:Kinesin-like protein n=1 Tax=Phytophthora ramorum TaxID=164328 RepID=H3G7K3_PHYRM